jgi:hypothetical protein
MKPRYEKSVKLTIEFDSRAAADTFFELLVRDKRTLFPNAKYVHYFPDTLYATIFSRGGQLE